MPKGKGYSSQAKLNPPASKILGKGKSKGSKNKKMKNATPKKSNTSRMHYK